MAEFIIPKDPFEDPVRVPVITEFSDFEPAEETIAEDSAHIPISVQKAGTIDLEDDEERFLRAEAYEDMRDDYPPED